MSYWRTDMFLIITFKFINNFFIFFWKGIGLKNSDTDLSLHLTDIRIPVTPFSRPRGMVLIPDLVRYGE